MNLVYFGAFAREQVFDGLRAFDLHAVGADSEAALASVIQHADILITAGPDYTERVANLVKSASHLGLIQLTNTGFENLIKFGVPAGAKVANAADAWSVAVAEHAMALMLALGRKLLHAHTQQQRQCWDAGYVEHALGFCGATLLIVGLGRIGRAIARRAKAFDMHVIAAVQTLRAAPDDVDEIVSVQRLATALSRADVVIAAVPSTPATVKMFNRERFAQCKRGALFINIARGDVVDADALRWALRTAQLGAAGIDVTDVEPLAADSRLWTTPNLLITPHVAGLVPVVFRNIRGIVADNVQRYMQGQPIVHQVQIPPPG